jgi:hypothetical protein
MEVQDRETALSRYHSHRTEGEVLFNEAYGHQDTALFLSGSK